MVKRQSTAKRPGRQGASRKSDGARPVRITAETPYGECSERLTAFGGLLALVKFLDLLGFEEAFAAHYVHPRREPKLGGYRMVLGILLLLFIGFQRLGHFAYVRYDPMVCGVLRVVTLPAVSTFWRYLRSLSIVQSAALLRLGTALRATVWALCAYRPARVTVNIDTTVSTVYGGIGGARKGHNPKHRGKKGLRPVLCFLAETLEYLCGTQRCGEALTSREVAREIRQFRKLLPACVQAVRVHGDRECIAGRAYRPARPRGVSSSSATSAVIRPSPKRAGTGTGTTGNTSASTSREAGTNRVGSWRCASARTKWRPAVEELQSHARLPQATRVARERRSAGPTPRPGCPGAPGGPPIMGAPDSSSLRGRSAALSPVRLNQESHCRA